jgi:CheY-like chemotaxis protein
LIKTKKFPPELPGGENSFLGTAFAQKALLQGLAQLWHDLQSGVSQTVKILVVDDEPIVADTLVDILNGEGYDALAMPNGESAVNWMQIVRPDAAVIDVMMRGMNGVETAKAILEFLPNCRIILFSGQAASTDLLARARAQGYTFEVLAKPVHPDTLLQKLKEPPDTAGCSASGQPRSQLRESRRGNLNGYY